jgi:hypothetical protein
MNLLDIHPTRGPGGRVGLAACLAVAFTAGLPMAAAAQGLGCPITFTARNTSPHVVDLLVPRVQVRSRIGGAAWGPWRQLASGGWNADAQRLRLRPGRMATGTYQSSMLCQDLREFRARYQCVNSGPSHGGQHDARSPSTRAQQVVLEVGDRC